MNMCMYMCMYMFMCMYMCMYVYGCICVYMYVCVCVYVCLYVCMYVCIYICMYMYVCRDGSSPPILGGARLFLRRFRGIVAAFRADFVPFYAIFAAFSVVLGQMVTHYIALNNIYCVFFLLFR